MIKKELSVYLRVPGNDQQKTDLVNTLAIGFFFVNPSFRFSSFKV